MSEPVDLARIQDTVIFQLREDWVHRDTPVALLNDLPDGPGPLIADVHVNQPEPNQTPPSIAEGTVELQKTTVFHISGSRNGTPADSPDVTVLPVAAMRDLGSNTLRAALSSQILANVLEALAFDAVVLPVSFPAMTDAPVTRVFSFEGQELPALCLFSSSATFDSFLANDPEKLFIIQHGAAVVDYVAHHLDEISVVVLDPAGPVSMTILAANLAAFLDEPEDIDYDDPSTDDTPAKLPDIIGFDLGLDSNWGMVNLANQVVANRQIDELVATQTRTLGDKSALVRRDMRIWLKNMATQAAQSGGTEFGFLLAHTKDAAAALSVVSYFHFLGPEMGDMTHLEAVTQKLAQRAAPDDIFTKITTSKADIIRYERVGHGETRLGGGDIPLLNIDYYIAAPDHIHLGHAAFTTPHLGARHAITQLADNIALHSQWITDDPAQD